MPSDASTVTGDHSVAALRRELAEAREQQAATRAILGAISNSPTDSARVFAEIAASAARLCEGYNAGIFRLDGDNLRLVAHHGPISAVGPIGEGTLPLTRGLPPARAVLERQTLHIADLQTETTEYPEGSDFARQLGFRAALAVPLMRAEKAIGVITIRRTDARPFTDQQVDLLKTFADQAVIAIENTRLFEAERSSKRELQESLEYQTATSEVLNVISRSPTELQPVLDAIAATAARLCESKDAVVWRVADERVRVVAQFGSPTVASALTLTRGSVTGRAIIDRKTIHVHDLAAMVETEYPDVKERQQRVGHRTVLVAPLLSQGEALGAISVRKNHVHPFSDRQIALLQTFADQAVIAIENARLFEEVQARTAELEESLEYQTATSEVLDVISKSPSNLQPVFDAIAETALRLCPAKRAFIAQREGDSFRAVARAGTVPEELRRQMAQMPFAIDKTSMVGRVALAGQTIHVPDVMNDPDYGLLRGIPDDDRRTQLAVPLLRDGAVVGVIVLIRDKVKPFTGRQINLVETFADQAVIAINNVGLFEEVQARTRELQTALEQQTATADVLNVISRSPNAVQPVFDTIVNNVARLGDGVSGFVYRFDGELIHLVAHDQSVTPEALARFNEVYPRPPSRTSVIAQTILDRSTVHVRDFESDPDVPQASRDMARALGSRSLLAVPMLQEGRAIGAIAINRRALHGAARPFSDRDIEQLKTFADQAVIAIENARLFEEVQARTADLTESLNYQTAIADVLRIISRSPANIAPIMSAIVRTARRLCGAEAGNVFALTGSNYRMIARDGADISGEDAKVLAEAVLEPGRSSMTGRVARDGKTLQVADVRADPEMSYFRDHLGNDPRRTALGVPLLLSGKVIGVINLYRGFVEPFTERQVALVETFADQAVIAIENARLFEAEQASKRELTQSLEYQTAISEVLGVISRSPANAQPVFESIAQIGTQLCGAQHCNVYRFDGQLLHIAATHLVPGMPSEAREANMKQPPIAPGRGNAAARAIASGTVAEISDIDLDPEYERRDVTRVSNLRSTMAVPMLKAGRPIGAIVVSRSKKGRFAERQIELLRTFADQAVIAIENTRLFEEVQARTRDLQESLEYQTAISDVLSVISKSPHALQPVLEAIMTTAARLCQSTHAHVRLLRDDGAYHIAASQIPDPELLELLQANPFHAGLDSVAGRAALKGLPEHVPDLAADPLISGFQRRISNKVRTALSVPLKRESVVVGLISLWHNRVQPFTQRQIDLVSTFADQAVIAINNVGLFEEVQARNRDLTALREVGRTVSSTLDLKVVLKSIVDRAVELSTTDGGSIFYYRPEIGRFELGETAGLEEEVVARFRTLDILTGQTGMGEAIGKREPLQIPDISKRPSNALRDAALEAGLRASLIVPLLGSEGPLGALVLQRRHTGEFAPSVVSLMQAFADQSSIALENARLFNEIVQKGRELEIASQHKSQFVANMSHELRTPLAAILGYAELMQEGFYEPLGQKSLDALTRIRSNGKHLLGLINTVLDIAKIEAGQFSLNLAEYALSNVVETVRAATESLAETKKLSLKTDVAKSLPFGFGDEQRLTQVLLNLVGNAIKFTDTGEVRISAAVANGHFTVSVMDTGPGIAEEHRVRIFEQFHQIDSSNTKAKGGTGLGLAIAKQIVEMHGGRIWVESMPGKGATFQMKLPTRAEPRMTAP